MSFFLIVFVDSNSCFNNFFKMIFILSRFKKDYFHNFFKIMGVPSRFFEVVKVILLGRMDFVINWIKNVNKHIKGGNYV